MTTPDLSPLIKGVIAIVGIAIALGQYGKLERWARTQALEAIAWNEPLPYFFGRHNTENRMLRPKRAAGRQPPRNKQ